MLPTSLYIADPTEGRILLDGVDLRDYDLDDLCRKIGVIFQDFVAYQLTVQDNIGLGDVVAVSHDRFFIDKVANRLLIFEPRGAAISAMRDPVPRGMALRAVIRIQG